MLAGWLMSVRQIQAKLVLNSWESTHAKIVTWMVQFGTEFGTE